MLGGGGLAVGDGRVAFIIDVNGGMIRADPGLRGRVGVDRPALLDRVIETRRPRPGALTHHSDRGCPYAGGDHRARLAELGITCSMSRRGDCWDNACMERFMNSYKNEWVNHRQYANLEEVNHSTFECIEIFYNRKRRHQTPGYLSPAAFEEKRRSMNAA